MEEERWYSVKEIAAHFGGRQGNGVQAQESTHLGASPQHERLDSYCRPVMLTLNILVILRVIRKNG